MEKIFQQKVLSNIIQISEFNAIACQHLRSKYFTHSRVYNNIAKTLIGYYQKYGSCITDFAFIKIMEKVFKEDKQQLAIHLQEYQELKNISVKDSDFVLDELLNFIKVSRWKILIEESVTNYLSEKRKDANISSLEKEASKILNIDKISNVDGYDYFDRKNIEERTQAREDALTVNPGINTGIYELDVKLNGMGFMPKELYLILGAAKRGKSFFLLWCANAATLRGKNVVYFTCEVSRQICCNRLDACNSGILFADLPNKKEQFTNSMNDKITKHKLGKMKIYEYPTKALTVNQIKEHLKKLEKHGFKPDIVLVDYLDLLKPALSGKDISKWEQQAQIAEDLRNISGEFLIPVVTASQINRSGSKRAVNDGSDIAGSFEKVAVADQVITLSATDDELANSEMRIVLAESRNNASGSIKIQTAYHYGSFFVETLSTDEF